MSRLDPLIKTRRGTCNEPRNVLIYLIRRYRQDSLKEIGRQFKIAKYSSVGSIIERVKKQLQFDRPFRKRLDELHLLINKSHEQTWPLNEVRRWLKRSITCDLLSIKEDKKNFKTDLLNIYWVGKIVSYNVVWLLLFHLVVTSIWGYWKETISICSR